MPVLNMPKAAKYQMHQPTLEPSLSVKYMSIYHTHTHTHRHRNTHINTLSLYLCLILSSHLFSFPVSSFLSVSLSSPLFSSLPLSVYFLLSRLSSLHILPTPCLSPRLPRYLFHYLLKHARANRYGEGTNTKHPPAEVSSGRQAVQPA